MLRQVLGSNLEDNTMAINTLLTHKNRHHLERAAGYITVISVLVIGAVGTALAVSLLLLGLGASRTSFTIQVSQRAQALANACAEEALQAIRNSTSFWGVAVSCSGLIAALIL